MAKPVLKWSDTDEIAFLLAERHPDVDPLTLRFTELHHYVTQLDEFADDPAASSESILETIQMAWLGYYRERSR
jgi:FeS assembly protein IscX